MLDELKEAKDCYKSERTHDKIKTYPFRIIFGELLVRIAGLDGQLTAKERNSLIILMIKKLNIDVEKAAALVMGAKEQLYGSADIDWYSKIILNFFDKLERLLFPEFSWELVWVDRELHEYKEKLMARLSELLGLASLTINREEKRYFFHQEILF